MSILGVIKVIDVLDITRVTRVIGFFFDGCFDRVVAQGSVIRIPIRIGIIVSSAVYRQVVRDCYVV